MNHTGFAMANDMTFFSVDAVNLLHRYNPVSYHQRDQHYFHHDIPEHMTSQFDWAYAFLN